MPGYFSLPAEVVFVLGVLELHVRGGPLPLLLLGCGDNGAGRAAVAVPLVVVHVLK